jgi:hypothetical protein
MQWKRSVQAFEHGPTSDPAEAAARIAADDGLSTGLIYRNHYPVFRPEHAARTDKLDAIEREVLL